MAFNDTNEILKKETYGLTKQVNKIIKDYRETSSFVLAQDVITCSLLNCLVDSIYTMGYTHFDRIELAEKAAQAIIRNVTLQDLMIEEEDDEYDF